MPCRSITVRTLIIKKDKDQILGYLEDASNLEGGNADILYIPETEEEVKEVVCKCAKKKVPLTVSAGGTGTVGSRISREGAILSIERLNKILSIDKENKRAVLQSGVIINDFLEALAKQNLFYPPFPTERTAFIGGNIATNASGEYSYYFGPTRNYVRRIKVLLSTGKLLDIERGANFADKEGIIKVGELSVKIPSYISPQIKNAAGYFSKQQMDLIDLFIGSEGTLGVITEAEVEIIDDLLSRFIMVIFLPDEQRLLEFVSEIKNNPDLKPVSLEYFDKNSLEFLRSDFHGIPDSSEAAIYIEEEEGENTLDIWLNLLDKYEVIDTWISQDKKRYQELIDFRHKLPEKVRDYFKEINLHKIALDIAVPDESFEELFYFYKHVLSDGKIKFVLYGHIGENHLHLNFFPKNEKEKMIVNDICNKAVQKAVKMGGTVSAEHGIGKIKHKYLEVMYGREGVLEMARVKKIFDPHCILGLDNIFPRELVL
ncbi:FAD-binding oxidoreductase [bacterium]|nr:FAD-binding oxidoreductase [bacterium]